MLFFSKSPSPRPTIARQPKTRFDWPAAPSPDLPADPEAPRIAPRRARRSGSEEAAGPAAPRSAALPSNVTDPYWRSMFV